MEKCEYKEVGIQEEKDEIDISKVSNNKPLSRKYILRQILIASSVCAHFFLQGLYLGSPTVIIPQLRREANSTTVISQEMVSWLSSANLYSGTVQIIILAIVQKYLGRKRCFIIVSGIAMCGFIWFYMCKTITQLIISAVITGVISANNITLNILIISEYTSPRYRGVFLTAKSASFLWGVWVSNAIGTFFHWKYIALVGCITTVYTFTAIVWPESPVWLASQRRFDESTKSHRWLKGNSPTSEQELTDMINYYITHENITLKKESTKYKFLGILADPRFYQSMLIAILVGSLYDSLGKMSCTIYALDILKKIVKSESAAYKGILILDGITIIGAYTGCAVSKFVKRRSFILLCSIVGIMFLFVLSLFMYLVNFNIIADNMYVCFGLLSMYSLAVSCGPLIMTSSLICELIPLTHRNMFSMIIGVYRTFAFATWLKVTPFLFSSLGYPGLFLLYASASAVIVILLFIYLPETKDKTILEIERLMTVKNSNFVQ